MQICVNLSKVKYSTNSFVICLSTQTNEFPHLIELQNIEQLEQLPILFIVLQLDIVLAEAVKGKLGFVIDVNFHGL